MISLLRTPAILEGLVRNTSWLLVDRVLRLAVNLAVGVYVARYLGPENYGAISYAISFVGLFMAFVLLGLPRLLVREIVSNPEQEGALLGTASIIITVGALIALILLAAIVPLLDISRTERWMILIIGAGLVFQSTNVIEYHFQATMQARRTFEAHSLQLILSTILKFALILGDAQLIWFAAAAAIDSLFMAGALTLLYRTTRTTPRSWCFSKTTATTLIQGAWPLILSTVAVTLYMKVDQIMIRSMLDTEAVGQYAASVRLSEAWYFIPVAITQSVFPTIISSRLADTNTYRSKLQSLFNLMAWLSIIVAIPVSLLSESIVDLLFGSAFAAAAPVLTIHIWAAVFVFINNALQQWYIAEGLERLAALRTTVGLLLNILLNLLLIPAYGLVGAAWATLASRALVGFLINFMFSSTRPIFWMIFRSLALGLVPGKP